MGQNGSSRSADPAPPPQAASQLASSPGVKEHKAVLPLVKGMVCIIMLAALCAGMAAAFTLNYLLLNNTLDNNGQWESTKQKLELFVMGAVSYTREPQAVSGFDMNLGAWHGFQEMLWRNKVHIEQLDFDFFLPGDGQVRLPGLEGLAGRIQEDIGAVLHADQL